MGGVRWAGLNQEGCLGRGQPLYANRVSMEVDGAEQYSVAYSYDANNRLLTESKEEGTTETITNYGYDNNGNQIAKWKDIYAEAGTDPEALAIDGSMSESYSYDGLNRLVRTVVGGEETTYTYRTDGLRHSKTSAEGSTVHLWDGSNIIADIGADDNVTTYLRGVNLIMSDDGEESKYYLYNGHGDVVQLADDSGDVLWYYDYDAFGVEKAIEDQDASLDANPFRYCAEYFDAETGSIYLRARYYNPTIGRFTSQDPIRDGLNWYSYCDGNPIAFADPFGLALVGLRDYASHYDGASVGWNASTGYASVTYDGRTIYIQSTSSNNINGRIYVDDSVFNDYFGWGTTYLPGYGTTWVKNAPSGKNMPLKGGWMYRFEVGDPNNPGNHNHMHVFRTDNSQEYSQKDDGGPKDKPKGGTRPPNSVIKELQEKTNWDWNYKADFWLGGIHQGWDEAMSYTVRYPDGVMYTFPNAFGAIQLSSSELINLYFDGYNTDNILLRGFGNTTYLLPMPTVPIPMPAPMPILAPI